MPNFVKLAEGIEVKPLLDKIEEYPDLWREINLRQMYPDSAHHSTETIFLRGPVELTPEHYFHDLVAIDYPGFYKLRDQVFPLAAPVMSKIGARAVGKAMIVKLLPHSQIDQHIDEGRYAQVYSRFHIVLQTNPDVFMNIEGQRQHMATGEAWMINHRAMHYVKNDGNTARIHLIFDAVI